MESLNIGELKRKALDVIKSSEYWMFAVNTNSLPRLNALLLYTGADALETFLLAPVSRGLNLFGIQKSRLTLEELNHVLDEQVRANSDIIFLARLYPITLHNRQRQLSAPIMSAGLLKHHYFDPTLKNGN